MKYKLRKVTAQERQGTVMLLSLECGHTKHVKHSGFDSDNIKGGVAKARCSQCHD
jgi:hypothetical protein